MNKRAARLRRARRPRMKARRLAANRLTVHRTPRHIYAQVLSPDGARTIVSASTLDSRIREESSYGGNTPAAVLVGKLIASRAIEAGVERVAFDRSGFKYHGRVRALAEAARDAGLKF